MPSKQTTQHLSSYMDSVKGSLSALSKGTELSEKFTGMTDVSFRVPSTEDPSKTVLFHANRIFFAMHSPVFKSMLYGTQHTFLFFADLNGLCFCHTLI